VPKYETTADERARVERDFTYHPPHGDQVERYAEVRASGLAMAEVVLRDCPPSRERSLALTNLEQACFWANAAIARNEVPTD
jgi:hypothetical protein